MSPPVPQSSAARFSLTFEKRRLTEDETGAMFRRNLDEAILRYLDVHSSVSTRELTEMSGLSRATVQKHINGLTEHNAVEPIYPKKSPRQRYRLRG